MNATQVWSIVLLFLSCSKFHASHAFKCEDDTMLTQLVNSIKNSITVDDITESCPERRHIYLDESRDLTKSSGVYPLSVQMANALNVGPTSVINESAVRLWLYKFIDSVASSRCESHTRKVLEHLPPTSAYHRRTALKRNSDERADINHAMSMLGKLVSCDGLRIDLFEFFHADLRPSFPKLLNCAAVTVQAWEVCVNSYMEAMARSNEDVRVMHANVLAQLAQRERNG